MYYYPNRLFSFNPLKYWFYIAIGSRGRGKTVSAWRWVLKRFLRYGELFVWLRLTETPIKKMARTSSTTLVPEFLLKQLRIESIYMRGATIYITLYEKGKIVTKMVGIMDSVSTFYTTKGLDMTPFTNIVFDEINRESGERNTFDVVRAFINQIETLARMEKKRVLMLGNTIEDTSEILSIFDFQPREFGIYKLSRRHCIIEYMDDSEEFKEARKKSMAGVLIKEGSDVATSFVNKSGRFMENIENYRGYRQIYIFFISATTAYGVYEHKGLDGASSGLFIGEVRDAQKPKYKISPFMTVDAIYSEDIYKAFYELVSVNLLFFEKTMIRARFIRALKLNRTTIG